MSYAEIRKYQDVLVRETPVPDLEDAAIRAENDPQAKAKHADTIVRLRKAKSELLTAVEKSSLCFLSISCAKNAREAWSSLNEQYEPTTVVEELQFFKKFNAIKLGSVQKNPVGRFCIPL